MKLIALTILFALITQCVNAGELIRGKVFLDSIHGVKKFGDGRDWFLEKRFGLFVTWGLYSIEGWQEQQQQRLEIPRREYVKLISEFDPGNFDPDVWINLAEKAGMEYITFVVKHMDGFCMWDTEQTDFKVTNSPYGKDILAQLADACHRRIFPLSIYYCLVDNHHISYPANGIGLLPFALKPQNAILLNDGSQVQYEVELLPSAHLSGLLQLHLKNLPVSKFCNEIMVIKLEKVFNSHSIDKN